METERKIHIASKDSGERWFKNQKEDEKIEIQSNKNISKTQAFKQ